MQIMSILLSLRKACNSGFFRWMPSAFHCTTLKAVVGREVRPVALLCLPLGAKSTEPPVAEVGPFEAKGPAPFPPGMGPRERHHLVISICVVLGMMRKMWLRVSLLARPGFPHCAREHSQHHSAFVGWPAAEIHGIWCGSPLTLS